MSTYGVLYMHVCIGLVYFFTATEEESLIKRLRRHALDLYSVLHTCARLQPESLVHQCGADILVAQTKVGTQPLHLLLLPQSKPYLPPQGIVTQRVERGIGQSEMVRSPNRFCHFDQRPGEVKGDILICSVLLPNGQDYVRVHSDLVVTINSDIINCVSTLARQFPHRPPLF